MRRAQSLLFPDAVEQAEVSDAASSTFVKNMSLPVHRWFRYSAGFAATWVEQVIRQESSNGKRTRVFDPFAGSGTTLIASENQGVQAFGIDSHPFVSRIAKAKLFWRSDPDEFFARAMNVRKRATLLKPGVAEYPSLIHKCYDSGTLIDLDRLRRAFEKTADGTPASELVWLTLVSILRRTSTAGTAQWQYILPRKQKRAPQDAFGAFDDCVRMIRSDMEIGATLEGPKATFLEADARQCLGVPNRSADLVITSPPYPNNYDYADATRLEMSFMREISGWGDLQERVRQHLVRSCSQHVPERAINLEEVLAADEVKPIRDELTEVCNQLATVRKTKGGKKTYHLMIACYFRDLAQVWHALRKVCDDGATVCFVIGDSAPYGVYVPVVPWLTALAEAAGFQFQSFDKTRDRNVKWKNRKHRVPLKEGRLWLKG